MYKVTLKQLLEIRNEIFVTNGIPILKERGFEKSPFAGEWFGRDNLGSYNYELCRLNTHSHLEAITTHITRKDRWIQIYLNIFELRPSLKTLDQLNGLDGMQFHLPPNSINKMRLRSDDFKGIPLFNTVHHKLKSFFTEKGFKKNVNELRKLIERDMGNIDSFVKRWHELHQPLVTDWEGNKIGND